MAGNKRTKSSSEITEGAGQKPTESLAIARRGLSKSSQLTALNVAVICDLLESRITSGVANAIGTQCARILKTKEMEFRYGSIDKQSGAKNFLLTESAA